MNLTRRDVLKTAGAVTAAAAVIQAPAIRTAKAAGDQVKFGARVTIVDEETEEEKTYRIVGAHEADMKVGSISISSPLGSALIGKC